MRNITFDGRLGKDAELLKAKNGSPYIRFNVANNSFVGGQEKTDWFDVVSYDGYIAEKRLQYLKKGTYVIITGAITSEINVFNGNIYLNHKVTATTIDTPRFGKPQSNGENEPDKSSEPQVSVYTATTEGTRTEQRPLTNVAVPTAPEYVPQYTPDNFDNDDDLPF